MVMMMVIMMVIVMNIHLVMTFHIVQYYLLISAIDDEGQPAFIGLAGSNKSLTMDHVKLAEDYIKTAPVAICDKGIPLEISLAALKFAKERGCRTLFNPSPTIEHLKPIDYTYINVMFVNAVEGQGMTGLQVTGVETAKDVVREIHRRGCDNVVLTLGKDGAVCLEKTMGKAFLFCKLCN